MKPYLQKAKVEIFMRLFFYLLYTAFIAALPYIIKNMIDSSFAHGYYDVLRWSAMFAGCICLGMLSQYITQRSAWKLDRKIYISLKKDLFRSVIRKNYKDFHRKDIGEYSSVFDNDISACGEYVEYLMEICEACIGLVIYATYIFMLDYKIALVIYAVAVIALFLPKVTASRLSGKKQLLLADTGRYLSKVMDLLKGYTSFDRDTYKNISDRHESSLEHMENSRFSFGSYKTFTNVFNGSVMYGIHLSVFIILAILLYQRNITAGIAAATIAYIQDFMFPLRTMVDSVSYLNSVKETKDAVLSEIHGAAEIVREVSSMKSSISVQQVGYDYERYSFPSFSYVFKKGLKYAITGESGKGKSTILKILVGNLIPSRGTVSMDGKVMDYESRYHNIAYISQESHIFAESFLDNVTVFGSFSETTEIREILTGVRKEYLYNCQDCSLLSGGEKQIISIIRALVTKRDVIVLDEPFSAMDSEMEFTVCQLLKSMEDKTVIMVTHSESKQLLGLFDEVVCL